MIVQLQNEFVTAKINQLGAELVSLRKINGSEVVWQGGDGWQGSSPVLFPIVGRLKNRCYTHNGKQYSLPLHGFALGMMFDVEKSSSSSAEFVLRYSAETLKNYPFMFELRVQFWLDKCSLHTRFVVKNVGDTMHFGVGWHTGFNVEGVEHGNQTQISGSITFEREEHPIIFAINQEEGLIEGESEYGVLNQLTLSKALFNNNTLLFTNLVSKSVTLKQAGQVVRFSFNSPYLAFWTHGSRGAFVCIEAWYSLPDYLVPATELKAKRGINTLQAGESFECCMGIEIL